MILLEVLIALSLTGILVSLLFSFFVQSAKVEKKLENARSVIEKRAFLNTRLQTIFTSLEQGATDPCFSTEKTDSNTSILLIYDNGIDPDPKFAGPVQGRIHLDEKKLCLTSWPLDDVKKQTPRNEVLFSDIEKIEFLFLGDKSLKKENEIEINQKLAWKNSWENRGIPSILRLKIWQPQNKDPLQFAIFMPSSTPLVKYLEKKAL